MRRKVNLSESELRNYLLNDDNTLNEGFLQGSTIDKLKNVAKKGLLTASLFLSVLPSLKAQDIKPAIAVAQEAGIEVTIGQKAEKPHIIAIDLTIQTNGSENHEEIMRRKMKSFAQTKNITDLKIVSANVVIGAQNANNEHLKAFFYEIYATTTANIGLDGKTIMLFDVEEQEYTQEEMDAMDAADEEEARWYEEYEKSHPQNNLQTSQSIQQ